MQYKHMRACSGSPPAPRLGKALGWRPGTRLGGDVARGETAVDEEVGAADERRVIGSNWRVLVDRSMRDGSKRRDSDVASRVRGSTQ
jgi:hypothetical protein